MQRSSGRITDAGLAVLRRGVEQRYRDELLGTLLEAAEPGRTSTASSLRRSPASGSRACSDRS